jgi:hypothetical protein
MNDLNLALALFLLLNLGAGLVRVLRGPSHADRMLAAPFSFLPEPAVCCAFPMSTPGSMR